MLRVRSVLLALACFLFSFPAFAQFNASIQGTVTDASGAVIPNATVKATNQETGVSSSTQTTGAGVYRLAGLPPGIYTVMVSATSFQDHTDKDVRVAAETPRGLNVQLTAGAATESVTVSASTTPELQTENANVSGTITSQQVVQLPSFGRDPYELLRLAPGVFGNAARTGTGTGGFFPNNVGVGSSANSLYQVENQPQISANGQRVAQNNFTIDGVDVNSLTHGGAAVVTPTEESIQEIKVLSSSYEAEDGRNSGAQVKVISKTGTNSLHGSGFFKYDEPGLNSFNKYSGPPLAAGAKAITCTDGLTTFTSGGSQCPVRVDNKLRNYGGSVGGPIKKDKLFFFFAYEGEHRNNITYGNNYVYTPQFINIVKQAAPNSIAAKIVSQPGIQPRVVGVLPSSCADFNVDATQCQMVNGGVDLGSPDTAGSGPGNPYLPLNTAGVGGARLGGGLDGIPDLELAEMGYPNPGRGNQFNGRVDWNPSSRHTIAASTYLTYANNTNPPGTDQTSAPSRDVVNKPFSPAGTLLWNWILSPTTLNEVRVNFSHFGFNEVSSNPSANFGIPDVEIQDLLKNGRRIWFGVPQGANTPGLISQNTYGFGDNLTRTFSRHNLKFGFEYRKEQNNNNQVGFARPLFTISRLWNFVNDAPIFEQNEVDPVNGNPNVSFRHFRTSYYGGFAQDDWKLSPTLTLNLGLRYEYYTPVSETNNLLSNLVLPSNTASAYANAGLITGNTVYTMDKTNFAPRFGFAWSPDVYDQKVVFRGGFGMYYDYIPEATFDPARDNPPFSAFEANCCGTAGAADGFGSPFDGGLILYSLGASNSPTSYPGNPLLGGGINPATNLPKNGGTVQVYFTPPHIQVPYVYGYSLETEMQMPAQVVVTLGYQGSISKHMLRIFDANQIFDVVAPLKTQVNPGFYIKNDVNANYNSLNVRVVRNFVNNFQVALKYRWSKSLDTASFGEGANASANETYPRDLATEYGPSDYDATNVIVLSAVARSPYLGGRSSLLGKIVGGWELSPIYTYQTGFPWTPVSNNCINTIAQVGICPIRPIAYFGGAGTDTGNSALIKGANFPGGGLKFFNPGPNNCTPLTCAPGVGRNSFRGPNYEQVDLTFGKQFPVSFVREGSFLELRMNAFNVFNHLNLAPYTFNTASTVIQTPQFGTPGTSNALAGRVLELQARLQF
jgi:carboxypeptidase family protein/TonB-dependent receptor-like protein